MSAVLWSRCSAGAPDHQDFARRRYFSGERRSQARDPADLLPLRLEPGGNGVEVADAGARLILAPDLKPIKSFHTHGSPPV